MHKFVVVFLCSFHESIVNQSCRGLRLLEGHHHTRKTETSPRIEIRALKAFENLFLGQTKLVQPGDVVFILVPFSGSNWLSLPPLAGCWIVGNKSSIGD